MEIVEDKKTSPKRLLLKEYKMPSKKEDKLGYIDSLRGVAILMVIIVHIAQKVPGLTKSVKEVAMYGQMGVQLFFILSAYTLCLSIDRRKGEKKLLHFYIRRFFRIAPLYYFGIFLYFIVSLIMEKAFNDSTRLADYTFLNIFSNVLFYHGFYPPAINNIVLGGWSIGAEMAFYVGVPFLFSAIERYDKKKGTVLAIPFIGLLLSLCFFVFLAFFKKVHVENNNVLYYNLVNQLPVFLLGISYYFYERNFAGKGKRSFIVNLSIFLILSLLSISLFIRAFNFTLIPFVSGLSFVFLIELFKNHKRLNSGVLRRIGQLSFSMYILHFLFAYYGTEYLATHLLNKIWMPEVSAIFCFSVSVLLTFMFAVITEKYIEQRGIKFGKYIISKW